PGRMHGPSRLYRRRYVRLRRLLRGCSLRDGPGKPPSCARVVGELWASQKRQHCLLGAPNRMGRPSLSAGIANAGGAPLYFDAAGVLLTTPESGAVEFDGNRVYQTNNTA